MDAYGPSSLNEGVELDPDVIQPNVEAGKILDEVLFKEIIPGEIPQLAEVEFDTLVTKLRNLDYAQIGLANQGGISQQIALENQQLIPGLITDACPMEFYTREVTKTRFNFALEAIEQEKKSVLSSIFEALVKFLQVVKERLVKGIEWIKNQIDAYRKANVKFGYRYERADNIFRLHRDAAMSQIGSNIKAAYGEEVAAEYATKFTPIFEASAESYVKQLDAFFKTGNFAALLDNSSKTSRLFGIMDKMKAFNDQLSKKISAIQVMLTAKHEAAAELITNTCNETTAWLDSALFDVVGTQVRGFFEELKAEGASEFDVSKLTPANMKQLNWALKAIPTVMSEGIEIGYIEKDIESLNAIALNIGTLTSAYSRSALRMFVTELTKTLHYLSTANNIALDISHKAFALDRVCYAKLRELQTKTELFLQGKGEKDLALAAKTAAFW